MHFLLNCLAAKFQGFPEHCSEGSNRKSVATGENAQKHTTWNANRHLHLTDCIRNSKGQKKSTKNTARNKLIKRISKGNKVYNVKT